MTTPRLEIEELASAQAQPEVVVNEALRALDVLVMCAVLDKDLTAPPGSPADGDVYIPASPATGAWSGLEDYIVYYASGWRSVAPRIGFSVRVIDESEWYLWSEDSSPGAWVLDDSGGGGGSSPGESPGSSPGDGGPEQVEYQLSCSDLVTALTSGAGLAYFRAPRAFALTEVRASLATESSSGAVQVDILKNGVSLLSTPLTIDVGEKTSVTAATPAVIDDDAVGDDDELSVDITAAGASAKGLIVTLIGTRV